MQKIRNDIKEGSIGRLYCIFGEDAYLRKKIRDEIKSAVIGSGDTMNYAYYEGKKVTAQEVIEFADTFPFMADRRLVIVEDCALNKKPPEEWVHYLDHIAETACIVLVESKSPDKRTAFYKKLASVGYVADLDKQKDHKLLLQFVGDWLKGHNCVMSRQDIEYFLGRVSESMGLIEMELNKLWDYKMNPAKPLDAQDSFVITREDIQLLCTVTIENQVFKMMNEAVNGNRARAFTLYYDLLALKEPPGRILSLMTNQFNRILQVKDCERLRLSTEEIKQKCGIAPNQFYAVRPLSKNLKYVRLKHLVAYGVQLETDFKTGRIAEQLAAELMLAECSKGA
jgi:DNA polymerase-3 subunit delta